MLLMVIFLGLTWCLLQMEAEAREPQPRASRLLALALAPAANRRGSFDPLCLWLDDHSGLIVFVLLQRATADIACARRFGLVCTG